MRTRILTISIFSLYVSLAGLIGPQAALAAGYRIIEEKYPYRGDFIPFKIAIWYPSAATVRERKYYYPIASSRIETRLALDAKAADGKFPIVFYAHGATGAGTSSFFICETLARNGYIVAAPDFLDNVCVARVDEPVKFDTFMLMKANSYITWLREFGLNRAAKEGRDLYKYRPEQMSMTIKKVLSLNSAREDLLSNKIDESRIGMFGHSFGAWTTALLAGAESKYADRRIKAAAMLSGPVNDVVYKIESGNDLAQIKVPVLFEFGELEAGQGRKGDRELLFNRANSPKFLLEIAKADHLSFSGGVRGEHKRASEYIDDDPVRKTISQTTLEFFDAFLKPVQKSLEELKRRKDGLVSNMSALESLVTGDP